MRHVSRNFVLVLTAIAATVMSVASQTPPAQKPSFEVASVRLSPNQSLGGTGLLYTLPGGKLTANAAMLRVLIFNAYGLQSYYQLIGGPDSMWIWYLLMMMQRVGRVAFLAPQDR